MAACRSGLAPAYPSNAHRMTPMDTTDPTQDRLNDAVTAILNAHDLLGVLELGAPADEYDPEMEDFVRLIAEGTFITPEVVATVWHKWVGDSAEEPGPPSTAMEALATDLQAVHHLAGG